MVYRFTNVSVDSPEQRSRKCPGREIKCRICRVQPNGLGYQRAYNTYNTNIQLLDTNIHYKTAIENADIALERFRLISDYLQFRDA